MTIQADSLRSRMLRGAALAGACWLLAWAPAHASQVSATFTVDLRVQVGASCGTAAADNIATVVCNRGQYRFAAYIPRDDISAAGDGYGGAGVSTAYRLVSLPGQQYIEMTVGW